MSDVFWRLSDGKTVRGLAESDRKAMHRLEAEHGKMQPWIRMHRVPRSSHACATGRKPRE